MLRRLNFLNWSITTKLTAIFLLVVAVPALVVSVVFLSAQQENFAELQNRSRLEALGPYSAYRVQQTFQTLSARLERLISDPDDYANLEHYLYRAPWSISQNNWQQLDQFIYQQVERYLFSAPSLSRIRFYDRHGNLLVNAENRDGSLTIQYAPMAILPETPADRLVRSEFPQQLTVTGPIYRASAQYPAVDTVFALSPALYSDRQTAESIGYVVFTQNLALAAQDSYLPDLYTALIPPAQKDEDTYAYLLDAEGQVALVSAGSEPPAGPARSTGFDAAQQGEAGVSTYRSPVLDAEVMGYYTPVAVADGPTYVLLIEVPLQSLQSQARESGLVAFIVIGLGVLVLGWAAALVATALIARPLGRLTQAARQIAAGRLDIQVEKQSRRDEIGVLTNSVGEMASQLLTAINRLQTGVQERTRNLETILSISRALTSVRDLDRLLQEVVNLIRDQFEQIYHAQVFLIDPQTNRAVLRASTGEAGRLLLLRGHYLDVGSQSVIGSVTSAGHAVVALDTSHNPIHRRNEFLPDTRAEMALPLRLGNRIYGALDLQSLLPDAFTEQDVELFQGMADQIMVAIDNARLFDESNARLDEIERLNRTLTREAWHETEQERMTEALTVTAGPAGPTAEGWSALQLAAIESEQAMEAVEGDNVVIAVPVVVRDMPLGAIEWRVPQSRYTAETRQMAQDLTARLGLTAENIRLFEQTQRALAETERLYETARAISSTSDLETIYQLIAEQLSSSPSVDNVEILLSGPDPALVQYLESVYRWSRTAPLGQGARERLRVLPMTAPEELMLPSSGPVIMADVRQEMRPDHPLYTRLSHVNAHSLILSPLSAAGRWFGLVLCSSRQRVVFQPAYIAFASALTDQLAIAIENRRLFDEAQMEARRARALAEAGQLASQIGGDYEAGLQNLFQAVSGPGNYDRWWFGVLHDVDGKTLLRRVAAAGPTDVELVDVQADHHALAEAARIGEIVLVNDPSDHPVLAEDGFTPLPEWARHLAMPVRIGHRLVGVLLLGRSQEAPNLDERDIQLAATLASQISVATQNQQLFSEAESQRQRLQTIVNTMPTGVLVMDRAGQIVLSNDRLTDLLGPDMRSGTPERPRSYPVRHAASRELYPHPDWPLSKVFSTGETVIVDDMVIQHPDGYEITVLAQAAPIRSADGSVETAIAVFQDISELQQLESALQDSLRETTLLYEASRLISRTTNLDDLMQTLLAQVVTLEPDRIYLLTNDAGRMQLTVDLAASYPPDEPVSFAPLALAPVLEREPVITDRPTAPHAIRVLLDDLGLQTLGSFPLLMREQVHGWIVVGFLKLDGIPTEQRRFLTTLADQAAVTIENQRLLLQTSDALEETAILYHASRIVTDATTPGDILVAFVYHATTVQVHYGALYMLLGEAEQTSYAAVELVAVEGSVPGAPAVGTRYRAEDFPLWNYLFASKIAQIPDLARMPNLYEPMKAMFAQLGLQSAVIIPLHTAEHSLGVLLIGLEAPWAQAEKDTRVYEALADQAAVSLENTRLYQQSQRSARQLIISSEISRAVTSILRLDELLPQVVDLIRDAFGYDHAQVFLINEDGTQAELVASTGEAGRKLLERHHSLPVGSMSVIGQVTTTRQPTIALDTADARVVHRPNPLLPLTRSEMALPLIARGELLGALDVQSNQPGAFTDEDARVLASLADMVATAIDNARLFESSRQHADEMAFLFNATTAATQTPDLQTSLDEMVTILRDYMEATRASIFLPDETGQTMVRGAEIGAGSDETDTTSLSIERGLIGWVARHNEAVVIGDLSQDPRRLSAETLSGSVMAVPLQTGGALIGVVAVESDRTNAFDPHDLQLLQTLSGSLAAIIQNTRLLREVQSANERLLEVDRLKTNFLAAMSHELRTPLNSIIGFSRVILKGIDGPLTETQEQDLGTIYESGKHLLGLVNDILDQAKIEAGKMELTFGHFKLQSVINGVMSTAIGLNRDKPVRLHTEIADNLPDAYGDEHRTRQVLLNLISNASKFTDEGSITVSAFPVQEENRSLIQVSVTDTGIGIAEKDMHLLFVPFQQIDNSLTRKVGGTGMGLPLAKSMVELQGGRIWVESQVGVGSIFSITVPIAPPVEAPDSASGAGQSSADEAVPARRETPAPRRDQKTILVIEQEVEAINTYRRQLAQAGYSVIGITTPDDLNKAVSGHRPRLIVLDVNLHYQAGWEVLATLKGSSMTRHIPVLVCTANEDADRSLSMGAAAHLVKPISEASLIEAVQSTVAHEQTTRPCILLIDDKPDTIRSFREALQASQQYDILEATSGQQAIEIIQQPRPIDLVVLDLRMPEIDGFVVLQALRGIEWTADVPVLVLTAEDVSEAERSQLATVDVFRKDDMDEERLIQHVSAQLGNDRGNGA